MPRCLMFCFNSFIKLTDFFQSRSSINYILLILISESASNYDKCVYLVGSQMLEYRRKMVPHWVWLASNWQMVVHFRCSVCQVSAMNIQFSIHFIILYYYYFNVKANPRPASLVKEKDNLQITSNLYHNGIASRETNVLVQTPDQQHNLGWRFPQQSPLSEAFL